MKTSKIKAWAANVGRAIMGKPAHIPLVDLPNFEVHQHNIQYFVAEAYADLPPDVAQEALAYRIASTLSRAMVEAGAIEIYAEREYNADRTTTKVMGKIRVVMPWDR